MRSTIHPYTLRLRAPLVLKGVRHVERRGCLLRIETKHGLVGWGDCAPLPGFSRETLDSASEQLNSLTSWVAEQSPDPCLYDPEHPLHEEIDRFDLYPSARFALELALLDLEAQWTSTPLPFLLDPDSAVQLSLNALLLGDDQASLLDVAAARLRQGYQTLKLKVGRGHVQDDISTVRALRRLAGPDVAIRCDANQAWTLAEATDFAEGILGLGIEYVEEPLREPDELGALWFDTKLPIALDESLSDIHPADLEQKAYVTALVLKPTLLGGMLRTMTFSRQARSLGLTPVLSGAFESGVAMRGHVALASATGAAPAGLDPYNSLAEDVLRPRLQLNGPLIDVPTFFRREFEVVVP